MISKDLTHKMSHVTVGSQAQLFDARDGLFMTSTHTVLPRNEIQSLQANLVVLVIKALYNKVSTGIQTGIPQYGSGLHTSQVTDL